MSTWHYYTTAQQVNPIVASVTADPSSAAGVQLETNCACWELRVFASLFVDPTLLQYGINMDGIFYPFAFQETAVGEGWATAQFILSSMNNPAPEVRITKPVSVSFQLPSDPVLSALAANPLYYQTYFNDGANVNAVSVSFHRGIYEKIR